MYLFTVQTVTSPAGHAGRVVVALMVNIYTDALLLKIFSFLLHAEVDDFQNLISSSASTDMYPIKLT